MSVGDRVGDPQPDHGQRDDHPGPEARAHDRDQRSGERVGTAPQRCGAERDKRDQQRERRAERGDRRELRLKPRALKRRRRRRAHLRRRRSCVIAVAAPISQLATPSRIVFPTPLTIEPTPCATVEPMLHAALVIVLTAPPMIGIPTLHGAPLACLVAACACTAAWTGVAPAARRPARPPRRAAGTASAASAIATSSAPSSAAGGSSAGAVERARSCRRAGRRTPRSGCCAPSTNTTDGTGAGVRSVFIESTSQRPRRQMSVVSTRFQLWRGDSAGPQTNPPSQLVTRRPRRRVAVKAPRGDHRDRPAALRVVAHIRDVRGARPRRLRQRARPRRGRVDGVDERGELGRVLLHASATRSRDSYPPRRAHRPACPGRRPQSRATITTAADAAVVGVAWWRGRSARRPRARRARAGRRARSGRVPRSSPATRARTPTAGASVRRRSRTRRRSR